MEIREYNLFPWVDWDEKESCNHLQSLSWSVKGTLKTVVWFTFLICCFRSPERFTGHSFKEWKQSPNLPKSAWQVFSNTEEHLARPLIFCSFPILYTIYLPGLGWITWLVFLITFIVFYKKCRLSWILNTGEQRQIYVVICRRLSEWISGQEHNMFLQLNFQLCTPYRGMVIPNWKAK